MSVSEDSGLRTGDADRPGPTTAPRRTAAPAPPPGQRAGRAGGRPGRQGPPSITRNALAILMMATLRLVLIAGWIWQRGRQEIVA